MENEVYRMLKQLFSRIKNTLALLVVFFVIVSITASVVSALSSVHPENMSHFNYIITSPANNTTLQIV